MKKRIVVLGSTGSIGRQALRVASQLEYQIVAMTARGSVEVLEEQIRLFSPQVVGVTDEKAARLLRERITDCPTKVLSGEDCLTECASMPCDIVLNAVVGMVGLAPTLAAIAAGRDVALANKETLVAGGKLVMESAARKGVRIYPVDSEHSAIFQSLQGCPDPSMVKRLILTASGGPFFGHTKEQLEEVTLEQALRHPNWSMGSKITVDSATMMNKGLELMEAAWLFDMPEDKIDVVVHRESVIHSLVEYVDHSVLAQLGLPDMTIPIQYALTYPNRYPSPAQSLDLTSYGSLTFAPPDDEVFPAISLCRRAFRAGGVLPAVVNGANEMAVELFLQCKIKFTEIGILVEAAMRRFEGTQFPPTLEGVLQADQAAREFILERLAEI